MVCYQEDRSITFKRGKYRLVDQIIRAARSTTANIAEGMGVSTIWIMPNSVVTRVDPVMKC